MGKLRVCDKFGKIPQGDIAIDTTSSSGQWAMLSPFLLPAGRLFGDVTARNVENGWQYAKFYDAHAEADGSAGERWRSWRDAGFANPKAVRYPMGRGARPRCSLWYDERGNRVQLGYIEARKLIYAPLYARAVTNDPVFRNLVIFLRHTQSTVWLRDWDGYDHVGMGRSIGDVIEDPKRKMGHAFVLWMLLTGFVDRSRFDAHFWTRAHRQMDAPLWNLDFVART